MSRVFDQVKTTLGMQDRASESTRYAMFRITGNQPQSGLVYLLQSKCINGATRQVYSKLASSDSMISQHVYD